MTDKVKSEFDKRLEKVEKYIANKGVGSEYLNRAQKVQRNLNLALVAGALLTAAGIAAYLANNINDSK